MAPVEWIVSAKLPARRSLLAGAAVGCPLESTDAALRMAKSEVMALPVKSRPPTEPLPKWFELSSRKKFEARMPLRDREFQVPPTELNGPKTKVA